MSIAANMRIVEARQGANFLSDQRSESTVFPSDAVTGPLAAGGSSAQAGRLHRKLNSFGVLLLTMSCLSPVFSIYGVGSDVLQHAGTGAAGLFLVGIAVAVIWATVYAELGSAFPYAGGDYVGVGTVLGPAAGFVCLALWAVTVIPVTGFLAKVVAVYVADLAGPAASGRHIWLARGRAYGRIARRAGERVGDRPVSRNRNAGRIGTHRCRNVASGEEPRECHRTSDGPECRWNAGAG